MKPLFVGNWSFKEKPFARLVSENKCQVVVSCKQLQVKRKKDLANCDVDLRHLTNNIFSLIPISSDNPNDKLLVFIEGLAIEPMRTLEGSYIIASAFKEQIDNEFETPFVVAAIFDSEKSYVAYRIFTEGELLKPPTYKLLYYDKERKTVGETFVCQAELECFKRHIRDGG